ncbi:MAG: hypothetical protein J0I99_10665 [Devosia sp.]|uniref:hypothetical protein n=1 Tax=Devosia sp. TaxID=1871048 RepID=UPI001ACD7CDB|nr:hypothetical protein [Devosia sp.]MBN9316192.1 hypothetical protein [Devosia sp.]
MPYLRSIVAIGLWLVAPLAGAQEYRATTSADATVRQAPGVQYTSLGVVPRGTPLAIDVCFDRGAYCAVSYEGGRGFVAGELLAIEGTGGTVRAAETARWAAIDARATGRRLPDWESRNIVVWGDSLSADTFGDELERLLPGRRVAMQGVPGEDGAAIARRRLATDAFDRRIAVIWDRHSTNQDPTRYIADLAPLFERLDHGHYIVISDIRSMSPELDVVADRQRTEAINARLRSAHPDNFLDLTEALDDPATRSDGLHLTQAGIDIVAEQIARFVTDKGW